MCRSAKIKKNIKETDWTLQTEATRAIKLLICYLKRQFMQKVGKEVMLPRQENALITPYPSETTHPDMTAIWEANLITSPPAITLRRIFMQPLTESIRHLIDNSPTRIRVSCRVKEYARITQKAFFQKKT